MSLASSPDCAFRPEDKALQMLFPSVEEGNSFDEFFNGEFYGHSDQEDSQTRPTDSVDFFTNETFEGTGFRPSTVAPASLGKSPPQPWRKGLWCLNQPALKDLVDRTRRHGTRHGEELSTSRLVNNENFANRTPKSPQGNPAAKETKNILTGPNVARYHHNPHARPPITREVTLSPSPMYASLPDKGREHVETWQQDFQKFHIRMQKKPLPISPSVLARAGHNQHPAQQLWSAAVTQNADIGVAILSDHGQPVYDGQRSYHAAVDPELLDPSFVAQDADMISTSPDQSASYLSHHAQEQCPLAVWTTESLHSSDSSQQSYDTHPRSSNSEHSAHSAQVQALWSPPICYHPQLSMAPQDISTVLAAPTPQRLPHQILHQVAEQGQSGLGIQYPELEQINQAVFHPPHPHPYYHDVLPGTALPYSPSAVTVPHALMGYSPLPLPPSQSFPQHSPFTPRKQRRSPSRSPSPSSSPTNITRHSFRQRSPTRTGHAQNQHRRKSIHKSGPIRDSHAHNPTSPLPPLPITSPSHSRRRSRSMPKTPRTPRTPRSPATPGGIDFVNFTPKDSAKLLSDVAPSGSSKTRARREQEERQKRKRLSEAAVKAVRRAGGDVGDLRGLDLS